MFIAVNMDLPVGVVVVVCRAAGQSGEVQRSMGRVGDGDIHRLERLTTTRVVRGDFNIVGVGCTQPSVDINIGGLIGGCGYLHRFNIARRPRTRKEPATRRIPSCIKVAVDVVEGDVDIVGNP